MRIPDGSVIGSPARVGDLHSQRSDAQPIDRETSQRTGGPRETSANTKTSRERPELSSEELNELAGKMDAAARLLNYSLQFKVAGKHQIVIRVLDSASGEVLREIPPETMQETFDKMAEALGVLLDKKV